MKKFKSLLGENYFQILCFIVFSILVFVIVGNLTVGINNLSTLRVFNRDEARGVELVQRCLLKNNFDPFYFYYYGMFYYSVSIVVLKIYFLFTDHSVISVFTIALVMRLISFCSLLLFANLFFKLCRCFLSVEWSWLCLLNILYINTFSILAQMVHPDMLMVALITLSFLLVFKKNNYQTFWLAAFTAGVAFGTKYNAIFCLPFLFIPSFFEQVFLKKRKIAGSFFAFFFGGILMLAGWLMFNPYSLIDYRNSLLTIIVQTQTANSGWPGMIPIKNPLQWFVVFFNEIHLFSFVIIIAGFIALLQFIPKIFKQLKNQNTNFITLFSYSVFCFAYLLIFVRNREMRYSFHFLPFLFLLFFILINQFISLRFTNNKLIVVLLLTGTVTSVVATAVSLSKFKNKLSDPIFKSKDLLAKNFSTDVVIYGDFYSALPEDFHSFTFDWDVDINSLKEINPNLIILNKNCSGKKIWKKAGTSFLQHDWNSNKEYFPSVLNTQLDFYNFLLLENSSYKIFYEDDDLIIFSKK